MGHMGHSKCWGPTFTRNRVQLLAMLMICRQTFLEGQSVLYGVNKFIFQNYGQLWSFKGLRTPQQKKMITDIACLQTDICFNRGDLLLNSITPLENLQSLQLNIFCTCDLIRFPFQFTDDLLDTLLAPLYRWSILNLKRVTIVLLTYPSLYLIEDQEDQARRISTQSLIATYIESKILDPDDVSGNDQRRRVVLDLQSLGPEERIVIML